MYVKIVVQGSFAPCFAFPRKNINMDRLGSTYTLFRRLIRSRLEGGLSKENIIPL